MTEWSDVEIEEPKFGLLNYAVALVRALVLIAVLVIGMILLLALRLIEVPIWGLHRPFSPYITQTVCRLALLILNIGYRVNGKPLRGAGAIVANHSSWMDIFTLNAAQRVYFVSKAEVANWPGIGWLARATGTVFIRRERRDAKLQTEIFRTRLHAGHKLLFFPEGTSTDACRVLPFKPTLFEAFFDVALKDDLSVQPVTVVYHAPKGQDARYYGWWGDMDFGPHLIKTLATLRQGCVDVTYHPPIKVAEMTGRKDLARLSEELVREAHPFG